MAANPEHHRALEILDGYDNGCTDHVLRILGFNAGIIDELLLDGLASAELMRIGTREVEVRRIRITDAGRKALDAG